MSEPKDKGPEREGEEKEPYRNHEDAYPGDRRDVPGGKFDPGRTPEEVTARTGRHFEKTDVRSRPMIIFMFAVLVALVIVNVVIGAFDYFLFKRSQRLDKPRSRLVTEQALPPEPRLQASPKGDMDRLLAEENEMLTSYGWANRKEGLVRIPIERAMDLVSQRGLPTKRKDIPTTAAAALPAPTPRPGMTPLPGGPAPTPAPGMMAPPAAGATTPRMTAPPQTAPSQAAPAPTPAATGGAPTTATMTGPQS